MGEVESKYTMLGLAVEGVRQLVLGIAEVDPGMALRACDMLRNDFLNIKGEVVRAELAVADVKMGVVS